MAQITDGEAVIDRMIGTAVTMLDTYLPAFMSVVHGNEEPGEAIATVEAGWAG